MSRAIKRKITVKQEDFFWVLNGNSIDGQNESHIKVHSNKLTKSILYLDPYKWHFEIRPKKIEQAIIFAKDNGWIPEEKGKTMYLSMTDKGNFYVLPEGVKFGYLDKTNKK